MIAATLSLMVMAGVLGSFLFFGRTGLAVGHYQQMESELRRGMEQFSEDARLATGIHWTSTWNITLSVPDPRGAAQSVVYTYEPASPGAITGSLYRTADNGPRVLLVREVCSDFAFHRYKIEQPGVADNSAGNDLETKQIQVNLRTLQAAAGRPASTQIAISARYLLRNKRVGQ